jgi:hypothetical protein
VGLENLSIGPDLITADVSCDGSCLVVVARPLAPH